MRRGADVFESRRVLAGALIAPAVIFILLLVGTPFVLAIYLSFTDATAGSLSGSWVGLHNFSAEWHDATFRHALRNTALMTLLSQAIIVINWVLVHTHLIGPACSALHQWPFHVGECTALNTPQWLGQENLAMGAIITVQTWRVLPFAVVIFLAGHASIPQEVEDAAKVDGATGIRKLIYVTLPLQLPIALVAILFGLIFTATDMAVVYILTNGGPFNSTQVVTTWAFQQGIQGGSLGEGAAVSLFLLPVLAIVAITMLFFARRAEVA